MTIALQMYTCVVALLMQSIPLQLRAIKALDHALCNTLTCSENMSLKTFSVQPLSPQTLCLMKSQE